MMCRFGYKDIPSTWPLMVALLDDFRPCFKTRDNNGDLVGAKGVKISDTTNLTIEAVAIREGNYEFTTYQEVPNIGKNIINMDKQNTPNMTIRQTNASGC
ncbi:hypothetical protein KY285_031092 [Solanum tuberosum]|nr:hypothetical protein KY285_031092 [Solanum tuberosum]